MTYQEYQKARSWLQCIVDIAALRGDQQRAGELLELMAELDRMWDKQELDTILSSQMWQGRPGGL